MTFDIKTRTLSGFKRPRESLVAHLLGRMIARIDCGHITIVLPSGDRIEHSAARSGPSATLIIHDWRAIRRLLSHGDLGFAESYIDGDWSSPDLVALLELAARNIAVLDGSISGFWPARVLNRIRHVLRPNSRAGSRKNISFHYDLGNAFYECWLDRSMTYSSALYAQPNQTLEEAQEAKLSRVEELLDLRGGENVLEIGCGWGTLAMRLARAASHVTGVTLSTEQLAYARKRVEQETLVDRVNLQLTDYRDVDGSYDRIVSIEMLEAVGEAYWPAYFETLHERLNVGGKAVLQVITIDEARYEAYRGSPDFIQRHIFPGGMLPTKAIIAEQGAQAGLKLVSTQMFGQSYAATLSEWRKRFLASWPDIVEMGFPERFRRLWDYYLCYCEAGFRTVTIDVGFFVFTKS
ncbi:class I SAM-dependent methyltransferase [Mesorhizobium sp. UC22_110]|uniref:class I SAM-dependent methyltransferase n=1 Tax=unclassified Mesorhizobium TaxID=325217 RepID=UPI00366B492E|nr:cyclopropane-fatty-acyl-phospholipid synthase family protein [Xanthobacteraceae bacterium]